MQATTGRASRHDEALVVEALYEIAVATHRLRNGDRVDTGAIRLLWHLAEAGPCRPSDLADLAGLDLSTVSRHVRDLGDAGYLLRTPDPRDRRAVMLEISADGNDVLADAQANRAAALSPVLAGWSPEDRAALTRLLAALARDLSAAGRPATDRPTTDEDHA